MAILTGVEVLSHCSFDLRFCHNQRCGPYFQVPIGRLYVFFGEMSPQVLCLFSDWVVCFLVLICMSCWHSLEINPLLVATFPNIFSYSVDCLFVAFMISFVVQKLVSLIHPFCCYFFCLGDWPKKTWLQFTAEKIVQEFLLWHSGLRIWLQWLGSLCKWVLKSVSTLPMWLQVVHGEQSSQTSSNFPPGSSPLTLTPFSVSSSHGSFGKGKYLKSFREKVDQKSR